MGNYSQLLKPVNYCAWFEKFFPEDLWQIKIIINYSSSHTHSPIDKTMIDSQKLRLNPEFKVEKFDNEILLYAISNTKGAYLNETAYLVWEMCAKNHSIAEIIAILQKAYPQQKEAVREDVIAAIDSLVDTGALLINND